MVLIRSARRSDTSSTATLSVAAFAHDELYCYLNPHKARYPDHFRDYFLRRHKLRLVDPTFHFLVAELEPGDDGYVGDGDNVVGYAIWTRKSPNPDAVAATTSWGQRRQRRTWAEFLYPRLPPRPSAVLRPLRPDHGANGAVAFCLGSVRGGPGAVASVQLGGRAGVSGEGDSVQTHGLWARSCEEGRSACDADGESAGGTGI
ncbi:MAG: hypothetical protein Q9167_005170 [Letrouitia subvulpina]